MPPLPSVWIVDDDPGIRESLQALLADEGFTVAAFASSKALQRALKKALPAIIFLDISLGEEGSKQVMQYLKRQPATCHIPLIIMSGNAEIETVAHAVNADGYVEKPCTVDDILFHITKHTSAPKTRRAVLRK